MNKKVVLTGGSGHLGYHIGKVLIKKKYKVLLLLRRHNSYTFELIRAGAKFRIVNFLDKKQIRNALKGYNILINTGVYSNYCIYRNHSFQCTSKLCFICSSFFI